MGRFRKLGLILFSIFVVGCVPALTPVTDPNPAGIGFGEEVFKLQGRVDYLYGHVQRNLKKLELQVGELQKTVPDLERGGELSALRADLLKLRDDLDEVREKVKAPPSDGLPQLRDRVSLLELALKKQDQLETKLLGIEKNLRSVGQREEIAALKSDLAQLQGKVNRVRSDIKLLSDKVAVLGDGPKKMPAEAPPASGPTKDVESAMQKRALKVSKVEAEPAARAVRGRKGDRVLLTIYFPAGSTEISPEVAKALGSLASQSVEENLKLSVTSFVSTPAPPPDERNTSASRANAVYTKLLNSGVQKENLSSTISASAEGWRNRKVEISRAE